MKDDVETRQVLRQNVLVRFLGAEDAAQGAEGLSAAVVVGLGRDDAGAGAQRRRVDRLDHGGADVVTNRKVHVSNLVFP